MNVLRNYGKYLPTTVLYYSIAFILLFIVLHFTGRSGLISNSTFINWDAGHYNTLRLNGYDDVNTAFFPLFPMVWKAIPLSPIGIGVLNFILFAFAISALAAELKLKLLHQLVVLSVPGLFFMFLPYAESFFFVAGVIAIIGFKRENFWIAALGLFLSSLTRPTTFIFIPAVLIMFSYVFLNKRNQLKDNAGYSLLLQSLGLSLLLVLGLFLSFYWQYTYTGKWFTFFHSQEEWGNKLGVPVIPLSTWGGDNILRYESTAFLFGVLSGLVVLLILFNSRLREKWKLPAYVIFSMLYLAGACAVSFLYRGGLLFSLNRFIYATPYMIVVLAFLLSNFSFTIKQGALFFFGFLIFSTLFASYSHIQNLLGFMLAGVLLSTVLLITNKNKMVSTIAVIAVLTANNIIAFKLICKFLSGFWVA